MKNVRWLVMAPDDLVVDDRLPDDEKVKILVGRGALPRRPRLEVFWNDPETGYVISAADAAALRRPASLGRHPKVYARLVWDRSQPEGGLLHGGKARRAGKGRAEVYLGAAGDVARHGADAVIGARRAQLLRHRRYLTDREGAVGGPDRESRARVAAVDAEISDLAAAVAKLTR